MKSSVQTLSYFVLQIFKGMVVHSGFLNTQRDFQKVIDDVKVLEDLSDSEITYFMRKLDSWDQKMKDIKGDVRKFKEDSIGKDEVQSLVEEITAKFKNLKETKDRKVSSLIEEDSNGGLISLCENS